MLFLFLKLNLLAGGLISDGLFASVHNMEPTPMAAAAAAPYAPYPFLNPTTRLVPTTVSIPSFIRIVIWGQPKSCTKPSMDSFEMIPSSARIDRSSEYKNDWNEARVEWHAGCFIVGGFSCLKST
jgi:hypothetical protein